MSTTSKINLPMDVAREISKYNDQTQEIEKLTAELANEKTTIEKLKVELEKAKDYMNGIERELDAEHQKVLDQQTLNCKLLDKMKTFSEFDNTGSTLRKNLERLGIIEA